MAKLLPLQRIMPRHNSYTCFLQQTKCNQIMQIRMTVQYKPRKHTKLCASVFPANVQTYPRNDSLYQKECFFPDAESEKREQEHKMHRSRPH